MINLVCPANPPTFAESVSKRCLEYCPSGKFALDTNRTCVTNCPQYYFINQTLTNVEYRCVAKCPNNTFLNSTNYCIKSTECPSGQYGNPLTGTCTANCPGDGSIELFADTNPNVKKCVYVCPESFYIQNITGNRTCVSSCLATYFINYVTRMCVKNCSAGTFALNNGSCVSACPSPFFS